MHKVMLITATFLHTNPDTSRTPLISEELLPTPTQIGTKQFLADAAANVGFLVQAMRLVKLSHN